MKYLLPVLALALGYVSSETVQTPEINVAFTSEGIQLSWLPVDVSYDKECFVVYVVTHQINTVNITNHVTEQTEFLVPFTACEDHTFIVVPRCRTGATVAEPAIKSVFTGIPGNLEVENIVIINDDTGVSVSWSRKELPPACEVSYRITVSGPAGYQASFVTTQNSHFIPGLILPPCISLAVTITPFDGSGYGIPSTATLLVEAGNAGTIRDLVVNNGRIEWTEAQDNGFCEVIYEVTIGNNGDAVTATTTDPFLDAKFVPCAIYNVIVNSRIGNTPISSLHVGHRARPIDVGKVENLQFTEVDGQIEVTWAPLVIGLCDVHYKLRFYINGVQTGSALTPDTFRRFPTSPCAENSVFIQPTVDMVMGAEVRREMFTSSAEPVPVENLAVTPIEDSLVATWNSVSVGFCKIHYIVDHIINGQLHTFTVEKTTAVLDQIACTQNEIRVTAVAGSSQGPASTTSIGISVESLPRVEGINIEEVEDGLLVSWNPIVKGLCDILYTISNFDGENTNDYETELTTYTIAKTTCANNTVTIVGVEPNSRVKSLPNYERIKVDIDLAKVRNLEVNRLDNNVLQINWERPDYSYHCAIDYFVNVRDKANNNFTLTTPETSWNPIIPMEPCEVFEVTVIPVSPTGRKGVVTSREKIAYLFHVHPVNDLIKHQNAVTWQRPHGTGICDLVYHVVVTDETGATVKEAETSETHINLDMVPCRRYTTQVRALDIFTKLISETIVVEGVGEPRFTRGISDLEYHLTRQTLAVTWAAAAAGDCTILYDVSHSIDNETSAFIVTEPSIDLETISCSVNFIQITPVIQEDVVIGEPIVDNILVLLDVIEPVQYLAFSNATDGITTVKWDAPRYSGNCPLVYHVEIFRSSGIVNSFTTELLSFNWNFVPCYEYAITITPLHNGVAGDTMKFGFTGQEAAHTAPTHVKTTPSLASADITLQANSFDQNNCPLEQIRILCDDSIGSEANVDITVPVTDNAERIFEIGLANLVHNTHYSCKAQWLTPLESEWGPVFEFLTVDIPTKSVEISDVTSTNFTVSWEEPAGLGRYILYHIVVITTYGPNHFVQESCDVPRNETKFINVPANVFTFTFNDALPNFKYHVRLITRYNIGVDSEAELAIVNTLPGVPGPITNLDPQFELEHCAEYTGGAYFAWTSPCNINGDLERYEVSVVTTYNIAGESRIHTANSTIWAIKGVDQYEFSAPIPTLNPFFNYSITVNTVAAFPNSVPTKLTYVQPPRAYTSCEP
ncbi:hypothetical protein Trydic_g3034 [Trypoxylus dichotomus]